MAEQGGAVSPTQEKRLLQTHNLVHRIVFRKLGCSHSDSVEDLKQRVFLKLWRWKSTRGDKDLSEEEWGKMANVVAHNEINDFFSEQHKHDSLFSSMDDNAEEASAVTASSNFASNNQAGNSSVETGSLLRLVWKLVQSLTLRQKYAFILHQPDFIIDFIAAGCCSMKEFAEYFEISDEEFSRIMESYQLSDEQIANLLQQKLGRKTLPKNVWEARAKAKAKIAKKLAAYISDGRLSVERKS